MKQLSYAELAQQILNIEDRATLEKLFKVVQRSWKASMDGEGLKKKFRTELGDIVRFKGRGGRIVEGKVVKMNPKRAKVAVGPVTWNVPYSLILHNTAATA